MVRSKWFGLNGFKKIKQFGLVWFGFKAKKPKPNRNRTVPIPTEWCQTLPDLTPLYLCLPLSLHVNRLLGQVVTARWLFIQLVVLTQSLIQLA